MKKLVTASFLLAGILGAKAQTTITLTGSGTTATTTATTTIGGGTSIRIGAGAGNSMTNVAANNTFIGTNAGISNVNSSDNTFLGWGSGASNNGTLVSPGYYNASYNTFIGRSAGGYTTIGDNNTFLGGLAGLQNTTGSANVYLGFGAGGNNKTGSRNVIAGWGSGPAANTAPITNASSNSIFGYLAGNLLTGGGNVLIGDSAGLKAGSNNVMIGLNAGWNEAGSNKLYIANSGTSTPLIWGDFAESQLKMNGKVGIGVNTFPANTLYSNYKLFVTGGILTDEVRVVLSASGTWADYVFAKDYNLKSLNEVAEFINKNGHLPNVPSAKEVKENGIALGDMSRIQQEKIEELTLYLIQQNKEIETLKAQVQLLMNKK